MNPEAAASAQFQIQKLYTKDVSFELPNAPKVFQEEGQADVKMSLSQRVEGLGENMHEVTLTVTVTGYVPRSPEDGVHSIRPVDGSMPIPAGPSTEY